MSNQDGIIAQAYHEKLTSIRGEIDLFVKMKAIEFDGTVYVSFLKYLQIAGIDGNNVGLDPIRSGFFAGAHSMDMLFFKAIDIKSMEDESYIGSLTAIQDEIAEFGDALDKKLLTSGTLQ